MKNIATIVNKEFARFFGDRRLFFTSCILPGLMIYVIYSLMGGVMTTLITGDAEYKPLVYAVNMPAPISALLSEQGIDAETVSGQDIDGIKERIASKEADACLVFPENFQSTVSAYEVAAAGKPAPNILVYYNMSSATSSDIYGDINSILNDYESSIANKFDINRVEGAEPGSEEANGDSFYNLGSERDMSGRIFSTMLPLLLIIFLYSGCMSVAPDSIAGEKERGTIATLLVTPIKRSELAIGKIISLAVIALICGLLSSLGMLLSVPKLIGAGMSDFSLFYTASDYVLLILVVVTTIMVIITLISIISAFARSVKEANTIAAPMMIVVMLAGVSAMMGARSETYLYLIPLYNSVQSMSGILAFDYLPVNAGVTIFINVVYSFLGGLILTRMFASERLIFAK